MRYKIKVKTVSLSHTGSINSIRLQSEATFSSDMAGVLRVKSQDHDASTVSAAYKLLVRDVTTYPENMFDKCFLTS